MFERILIVDDDDALRESLEMILASEGFLVTMARDAERALACVESTAVDIVLCDLGMPGLDGFELLPQLARKLPGAPIVLMSDDETKDLAREVVNRGAYDFIARPLQPSALLLTLRRAQERERLRRAHERLRCEVVHAIGERPIVAASKAMIDLLESLERMAEFKSAALLTGESGSGKEVLARAAHAQSARRSEPFIAVNCGAIPESRLESELFGQVKGAPTGASRTRRGLFVEADGGTLFFDEIAALPLSLQEKLLRVLRDEEFAPVGGSKPMKIDLRVIAATAHNLEAEVSEGRFQPDLYDRLSMMHLEVPALRDRREDIPLLSDHFLAHYSGSLGKNVRSISDDTLERLVAYSWPGNVRELQNVIERAVILADRETLGFMELPSAVTQASSGGGGSGSKSFSLKRARGRFEADWIRRALRETGGNRTHAARLLEISHRSLLYKLKGYGIRD